MKVIQSKSCAISDNTDYFTEFKEARPNQMWLGCCGGEAGAPKAPHIQLRQVPPAHRDAQLRIPEPQTPTFTHGHLSKILVVFIVFFVTGKGVIWSNEKEKSRVHSSSACTAKRPDGETQS